MSKLMKLSWSRFKTLMTVMVSNLLVLPFCPIISGDAYKKPRTSFHEEMADLFKYFCMKIFE